MRTLSGQVVYASRNALSRLDYGFALPVVPEPFVQASGSPTKLYVNDRVDNLMTLVPLRAGWNEIDLSVHTSV
jgi:hypothetical protein